MLLREALLVVLVDNPLRKSDDVLFGLRQTRRRDTQRPDRRRAVSLDGHIKVLSPDQFSSPVDAPSGPWRLRDHHGRWLEHVSMRAPLLLTLRHGPQFPWRWGLAAGDRCQDLDQLSRPLHDTCLCRQGLWL